MSSNVDMKRVSPARCHRQVVIAVLATLCAAFPTARAATPSDVEKAINKGKAFVYAQQKDGTWETVPVRDAKLNGPSVTSGQWGGLTAISTYALLAAGESAQDARVKSGIDFLRTADMIGSYAVGLRAQVWHFLPRTNDNSAAVLKDAKLILTGSGRDKNTQGFYGYTLGAANGHHHSPSQYGVLGMWAVEQAGAEVPADYWQVVDAGWRLHQQSDGGWSYQFKPDPMHPTTPSMTAAGVASLFITQDYLNGMTGLECKGNISDANIERGLKYMSDNFNAALGGGNAFYTLYGIERIGVASGRKYFDSHDWYTEGADFLIKKQLPNGSWGSLPNTCFSLLFLSRGRAPVVMNKLQYEAKAGTTGNWNQRPRDVANVVQWIGSQNERSLNWQSVNLDVPVSELLDAPILYIAGNQALDFNAESEAKLKEYVERGGMIVANAECGSAPFATSVRKLGQKLFPAYEFRELPNDHPIYTKQQYPRSKWRTKPSILGLSNGTREFVILVPAADLSRSWQAREYPRKSELFEFTDDLFLYAVDKESLRVKGDSYVVTSDPKVKTVRAAQVARLQYDGNWDPEPGGWRRLTALMHNLDLLDLKVDTVKVENLASSDAKLAHLTGTNEIKLTEPQRTALRKFIDAGGTLVVDVAGGASAFALTVERELSVLYPQQGTQLSGASAVLPIDHPFYATKLPGVTDATKSPGLFRSFARVQLGGDSNNPQLRKMDVAGRPAIFYSRQDLSTGLVGQPVDGVVGYTPAAATDLMRKIILSVGTGAKVKAAPTTGKAAPTTGKAAG